MKRSFDILDLNNCLECFKKVVNNKKTKKIVISSIISAITISTVGCIDQESFSKMLHENNIPIFSNSNNEKTKETELKSPDTIQNDIYTETDVITDIKPLEEDSCIEDIINEVITNPNDNTNISESKELVFDDSIGVPVLMYHNIVEDESKVKHDRYQITTENLENQLLYLKDNGYTTICLNDLYEYMINKIPIPQKSVIITFDDGYYSNYKYLYDLLKKHDMHADIGVITGLMKEKGNPNAYFT